MFVGWLFVTDLISGGGNWTAVVTLFVGLVYFAVGSASDKPSAFWLQFAAGLLIGGSLLYWWHSGDTSWALIAVGGLVYCLIADRTHRSSWAVLGTFGFFAAATHFAREWASGDDLGLRRPSLSTFRGWVPPLVFAFVGFLLVVLGLYARRRNRAATAPLPPSSRLYNSRRGPAASDRRARRAGQLPRARGRAAAARRRAGRGAAARAARGPRRADRARRRVDGDEPADAPLRARRGAAAVRGADLRHLRRDDPARPRPSRARRHRRAAERVRPAGRELRGRSRPRPRRGAGARRVHPRAVDRGGGRRASRCSPRSTGIPCSRARAGSSSRRSIRS